MMKILNVYLKNLNSLAGEWFIDFENQQLQNENLFLISGPTGSGKSTLLDAICLALYGRTPRLDSRSSNIPSVSEIITRHANEACAEVLFECRAGRFRASWSQSRGSGKNAAKVRTKHLLMDAANSVLSDKITDTQRLVSEYAGLTYQEFTRAILLAQGSFAAFLSAPGAEKAQLLEKLANAGIYRKLSMKAWDLNNEAKKRRQILLDKMQLLDMPKEGEEEALRLKIIEKTNEKATLEKGHEELLQKERWRDEHKSAQNKVEQINREMQAFEARKSAFAQDAARLETGRKIAPTQAAYNTMLAHEGQYTALKDEDSRIAQKANNLFVQNELLRKEHEKAKRGEEEISKEFEKQNQIFEKVCIIDNNIAVSLNLLNVQEGSVKKLETELQAILDKIQKAKAKNSELITNLSEYENWLAKNAADEWLVENLGALRQQFENLERLKRQVASIKTAIAETGKNIAVNEKSRLASEKNRDDFHKQALQLDSQLKAAKNDQKKCLAEKTLEQLKEELKKQNDLINERQTSEKFSEQRALLVEDKPCPLCGALHHPYAQNYPAGDLEIIKKHASELEQRLEEADKRGRQIERIENNLNLAKAREQDAETQIVSERQHGEILQKSLGSQEEDYQNNMNLLENEEESIRKNLAFLSLAPDLELGSMKKQLEKRLENWRLKNREREKYLEESQLLTTAIQGYNDYRQTLLKNMTVEKETLETLKRKLSNQKKERWDLFEDKDPVIEKKRLSDHITALRKTAEELMSKAVACANELAALSGSREQLEKNLANAAEMLAASESAFQSMLAELGMNLEEFRQNIVPEDEMKELDNRKLALDKENTALQARMKDAREHLESLAKLRHSEEDLEDIEEKLKNCKERQQQIYNDLAVLHAQENSWAKMRDECGRLQKELQIAQIACDKWGKLSDLIGSAGGDNFVKFVQGVTLDLLVKYANRQLEKINTRYKLQRSPNDILSLVVTDTYMANEVRPVGTLSGGETFLVSLALALGLSAISSRKAEIGSLFLDEGFGSLDTDTLSDVIMALENLRNSGRLTGIISHVEQLKEKIPMKLEVKPLSSGHSMLEGVFCSRKRQ